ncbi:hypothetical protein N2152v2_009962 [Parachlorella kessleri]
MRTTAVRRQASAAAAPSLPSRSAPACVVVFVRGAAATAADPTAFSAPKHLALSQEEVSSNVKPELAALAAEGLSPKQEQQVPAMQVAHMLVEQPTIFGIKPGVLSARLGALQQHLGLDAAAALHVAIAYPRLVRAQPTTGALTATSTERSIKSLAARGYSQERIRGMIGKQPTLLHLNLDSPLQQQKLCWIEWVSPWTLDDFLYQPAYFMAATRRLAARLALLQECGLPPPSTPSVLTTISDSRFMVLVQSQVARQGRELPCASWAEWEEAWLDTIEGREWGFPPLKD